MWDVSLSKIPQVLITGPPNHAVMRFRDDERGLALGLVTFIAMLVIGGLLFIVMNDAMVDVFDITSSQASQSGSQDQINSAKGIWDNIMFYVLFIASLFLIARAIREGARA